MDPFDYIQRGLTDARQGFQQGLQNSQVAEDRRIAAEQRQAAAAASKAAAASIRAKPAIWRDANAAASLMEGYPDPNIALKLLKQEFAPRDPGEGIRAYLIKKQTDALETSMKETDPVKNDAAKAEFASYGSILGNFDVIQNKENGTWSNPILDMLNDSSKSVLHSKAVESFTGAVSDLPKDSPLRDMGTFFSKNKIWGNMFKERAELTPAQTEVYNQGLRTLDSMGPEDVQAALKKDKIETPYKDPSTGEKIVVRLDEHPALKELMQKYAITNYMGDALIEKKIIPAEYAQQLQLAKSQDKNRNAQLVLDPSDIFGKVSKALSGDAFVTPTSERLKASRSLKKKAAGVVSEVLPALPLAGANMVANVGGKLLSSEYQKRLKAQQEE